MAFLYLTEQGSILRKTGQRLIIEKDGQRLLEVPAREIETILIFGRVQVTTQALHTILANGIELSIFTHTGKLLGQLTSPMPKNVELRIAQYEKFKDANFVLQTSKSIVAGKILNSLEYLRRFSYNHKDINLSDEIQTLTQIHSQVKSETSPEALLGLEGFAARVYYMAFSKMILGNFGFDGRRKRPAPDPVNALLSFGYTLIFNEIASLLDGIGFDPYIGFFHKPRYGRSSLAADLVEEFRSPVVDRLTLRLINNRILTNNDFYLHQPSGSMRLKHESLKRYFPEYEKAVNNEFTHPQTGEKIAFRRLFRIQAQKLAQAIIQNTQYIPFHYDR